MPLGGAHVQGRAPAPGVGAVHDVVLDEGEQVEQLERGGHPRDVLLGVRRPPATTQPQCASTGRRRLPWCRERAARLADEVDREGSAGDGADGIRPLRRPAGGPLRRGVHEGLAELDEGRLEQESAAASISSTDLARRRASGVLVVTSALIDPTASSVRSWVSIEPDPFLWQQPRQPWAGRASLDSRRPGRAVEQPRGGARVRGGLADGCRQVTRARGCRRAAPAGPPWGARPPDPGPSRTARPPRRRPRRPEAGGSAPPACRRRA